MGSSGVGKSTLVNALAGEVVEATAAIREDDARGRHTTTRRHLVRVPGRGLILDTPGMRELGLADDDGGLDAAFADIDALAEPPAGSATAGTSVSPAAPSAGRSPTGRSTPVGSPAGASSIASSPGPSASTTLGRGPSAAASTGSSATPSATT